MDTLAYAKRLKAAGVSEQQAEAHAEALNLAVEGQVATKADIAELRGEIAELRGEIADLRTEFQRDLAALENRVTYKMAGLLGLAVAI